MARVLAPTSQRQSCLSEATATTACVYLWRPPIWLVSKCITGSSPAPRYQLYVGVDIAAKTLTAAWMAPGAAPSRPLTVDQTPQGFATLQERLLATGHPAATILVVMEATGSYWVGLATTLAQAGFVVSVVNAAQAHHFAKALLKRAKTDAIDAQTITQLAARLEPAPWTPPPAIYTELQQRLARAGQSRHVTAAGAQSTACSPASAGGDRQRAGTDGGPHRHLRRTNRGGRAGD